MTNPAPGATGVPTTIGAIVVPADGLVQAKANVVLTLASGKVIIGGLFANSANGTESASLPVLAPHTTYKAGAWGDYCAPPYGNPLYVWSFGSFTTS